MKKVLLIIAIAISSSVLFGQKNVDWSVSQIISPSVLQSVKNVGTVISWDVVLKNNGPDSVLVGDTIYVQWAVTDVNGNVIANLLYPGPSANTYAINLCKKDLGMNDTIHYVLSVSTPILIDPSANVKVFFRSLIVNRPRGLNFETTITNNALAPTVIWYNWQKWAVSVSSVFVKGNLDLYPNPAKDVLNIHLPLVEINANVSVGIFDILGNKVMNETFAANFENISLNTSTLSKGIYIVQVINGGTISSSKLVIE